MAEFGHKFGIQFRIVSAQSVVNMADDNLLSWSAAPQEQMEKSHTIRPPGDGNQSPAPRPPM